MSKGELKPLYEKLNSLAGHLAPTYGASAGQPGKFMKGNLATVSIGDYLKNQPGFISSIGFSWNEIQKGIVNSIKSSLPAILILLLIGALAGTWMISGIVPTIIYKGLKIINPSVFFKPFMQV